MDAATDWVVSGGRYALDFDGSNDLVATGSISSLNSATNFSISYWGRKATSVTDMIVGSRISGTDGVWLQWFTDGVLYFSVRNGATSFISASLSYTSSWIHFAATHAGTVSSIYVNGSLIVAGTNGSVSSTGFNDFAIGSVSGGFFTTGQHDDVLLYNRTLSPAEIRLLATRRGIAYERRKRKQVYFDAAGFNPAWARNSNVILSPVGAA